MTTIDTDSVTWEFDAPMFCDLNNPEAHALRWNDSWFKESRLDSSQTRNNRRLRARQPLPELSRLLPTAPRQFSILSKPTLASRPLPAPQRPIQVQSTQAPASTGRDIIAALASTQQQKQQQHAMQPPPVQRAEEKTTVLGRFAQPTAASLNKARTTGTRDVAIEIKRITSRFAKKPQDKETISSSSTTEQSISKKGKEVDRRNWANINKENMPPHQRETAIPYRDLRGSTEKQPEAMSSLLSHQEERLESQEIGTETTTLEKDQVSQKEDVKDQEQQSQHDEVDGIELDKNLLHQMDTEAPRSLAQELAPQRESIHAPVVHNDPPAHAAAIILSPSRQSKVSQQEQSLTSTTIRVGRERMRQWLDDQTADPDTVETNTSINLSTALERSPEKPRSEPVKAQSIHAASGRGSTELQNQIPVSSNFDALLERMNAIRSQLLQVANTSSIKHTESTMIRNKQHLEAPTGEKRSNISLPDDAAIDRRIARARRVIEESKRGSKRWFVKDPNMPVPPIMAPMSTKRKASVEESTRPKKITKPLSVLSAELQNTFSRRDSMDKGLSVVERIERLKQSASRRASRVSSTNSVYLPIAPTVPKSPAFATDARSRLSIREHYS